MAILISTLNGMVTVSPRISEASERGEAMRFRGDMCVLTFTATLIHLLQELLYYRNRKKYLKKRPYQ